VWRQSDANDPLDDDLLKVSPGFKAAKKKLKAADETLLSFAKWSEDRGDHEEAQRRYRDLLADNPDNVDARVGIARVEFKSGRKLEAEKILQSTVRKFPDNTEAWIETGRLYSQMEQWGKAVQSFEKAIELDQLNRTAQYEMGLALAHNERLSEAVTHLTIAGGESAALYNVGYILHQSGRNEEAAQWFRRTMASQPDEQTRRNAGQMLATLGFDAPVSNSSPATQLVSSPRPQSVVDVEQTSYQSYRETPGVPSPDAGGLPQVNLMDTTGRASVQFPVASGLPIHKANMPTTLQQPNTYAQSVQNVTSPGQSQPQGVQSMNSASAAYGGAPVAPRQWVPSGQ
jgi:tetratricopeptide (TPR) repeat protein